MEFFYPMKTYDVLIRIFVEALDYNNLFFTRIQSIKASMLTQVKPFYHQLMLFLLLMIPAVAAGEAYTVTSPQLNVRKSPSTRSSVLFKLDKDAVVEVCDSARGNWVKIEYQGQNGYVNRKYLQQVGQTGTFESKWDLLSNWFKQLNLEKFKQIIGHESHWPVYVGTVLGLLILLIVYLFFDEDYDTNRPEVSVIDYVILFFFLGLCVCEIIQFLGYQGDTTWFCSPHIVGWIWTIVNFIVFTAVIYAQVMSFILILGFLDSLGNRDSHWRWNFYAIIACVVIAIIGIFYEPMLTVAFVLFALTILAWPFVLIYYNIQYQGSWMNLVISYVFYLFGLFSIIVTLAKYIPLLMVAIVGFIILKIIGSDSRSPTIYVEGEGYITGRGYHGGDRFRGDNGYHYYYDGSDWHPL